MRRRRFSTGTPRSRFPAAQPLPRKLDPVNRLGTRLKSLRGARSLVAFAKALGLSYTFVREMERGNRLPSDDVIVQLAERLGVDAGELALLTYCDRSQMLAEHLRAIGVDTHLPELTSVPAAALPTRSAAPVSASLGSATTTG
ncbi:MAG: helix-turn-helix transcriptional regulator [Planctomycetes bacterium]|nr:helix-turn-helix transcriptional regulator [Planctomycetota bacterium]